ncbi:hypothetical protein NQD34_018512 [Periophthalmus magnuspinnatus]|nr:hypothetical protein NQD34_018512 [Periophthalmus magnuspinnatus]
MARFRETGGRNDVVYNIVCRKCRADRRSCSHCDENVDFVPRQLALTDTRVFISNLVAHTLYSFEIQAVNGVSNKSPYPAQHVTIDITTNQAGKWTLRSTVIMRRTRWDRGRKTACRFSGVVIRAFMLPL